MEELRSLFNAELVETEDGYAVEVPHNEVESGDIDLGDVYRVALIGKPASGEEGADAPTDPQPPVEEGEIRYVEIEDLGDQGDGIARVERGYVIIVPDTAVGDRLKVEIDEVRPNFAAGVPVDEGL